MIVNTCGMCGRKIKFRDTHIGRVVSCSNCGEPMTLAATSENGSTVTPAAAPLEPVRVKAYGLFPMTRSTYLILQVVLAVLMLAVLYSTRSIIAHPGNPFGFVNDYFYPFIVIILGAECIETVVMLSKFKKAEQAREPHHPDARR